MYRESASRFSRGTVLNTLKQSGINILRGKKDTTTFSRQACFVDLYIYIYIYIIQRTEDIVVITIKNTCSSIFAMLCDTS